MNIKIHKSEFSVTAALCDEDLIGKTFKEKDIILNLSPRFYKGTDMPEENVIEILKGTNSSNIVGEKSVKIALKSGIIEKENIRKVKGIPFAISVAL